MAHGSSLTALSWAFPTDGDGRLQLGPPFVADRAMESSRGVRAIDAGSMEGTTTSHAESSSASARDGNSAGALGADDVEAPRHSSRAHKGHAVQLVLTALHASAPSEDAHSAAARLYKHALVDHFDETLGEERTWKQRYYVDARFWGGHGYPVFLYMCAASHRTLPRIVHGSIAASPE
eukprot:6184718-Pleurochrysis_carterae.AAC.5